MTEYNVTTKEEFYALPWIDNNIVVLFTSPSWCVPCQRLEPHWNKLKDSSDDIIFVTVNMGESPEDTGEHWATEDIDILGVPQIKLWTDGDNETDIKSRAIVPLIKELLQYV